MTTMGVTVFCNRVQLNGGEQEQLMLLRTLRDNESNISSNQAHLIVPKNANANANANANDNVIRIVGGGTSIVLPGYDPSRLKKHGKNGQPAPVAVARRNARERNRVKQVNNGFATLRQRIPGHIAAGYGDRGKKLSKVETLRMAVEYIRGLQRMIAEADGIEYDPNVGIGGNVPSPSSSVISSSHNGSGEPEDEDVKLSSIFRSSPIIADSPDHDFYSTYRGDEENFEPLEARGGGGGVTIGNGRSDNLGSSVGRSVVSPDSVVSSPREYYGRNEENVEPRVPISPPYSGGDSEEGGTVYAASPETFSGAVYYKQEITTTGDAMDVVSWWEQEQGRHHHLARASSA